MEPVPVQTPSSSWWDAALDSAEAACFVVDPVANRLAQFNQSALRLSGREVGLDFQRPA